MIFFRLIQCQYFCTTQTTLKDFTLKIKPPHKKMGTAHNWRNTQKRLHFWKRKIY